MQRTLPIAVLLLVAAAFHARSEERPPLTRETLGGIVKEAYVGDPMLACRVMDDVLRGVDVAALPDDVRAMTDGAVVIVMTSCGRNEDALVAVRRLVVADPSWQNVGMLAYLALQTKHYEEAGDALVRVAREWPGNVNRRHLEMVSLLHYELRDSPDAQRAQLQRLFDAGFDPVDGRASGLWLELVRLHLDAGDIPRARAASSRVDGVASAVAMRIDRRFDPLTAADPSLADIRVQGQRALAAVRAKAEKRPNDIALQYEMVDAHLMLGEHAEVDALVTAMTDMIGKPGERDLVGFNQRSEMLLARATMHRRNGNIQGVLEDAEMASLLTDAEYYDMGKVRLAGTLCYLRRTKEAAAAIDHEPDASDWLQQVQRLQRVCIAVNEGDITTAKAHLAQLREEADISTISLLLGGQLFIEDVEGAAATYIAMLTNPATRIEALEYAQRDRNPPLLPGEEAHERAFQKMRDRDDVKAAIEKVGRVETWDIFIGYD